MGLRQFKLPDDVQTLLDVIPPAFQYPEHPEWSIDTSDEEDLIESTKSVKTIWPFLKVLGFLWKPAQDLFLGFVWEEDGQPVGLCNIGRQGGSQQWMIGNVAVLPDYRRRGIARKLVQACVDLAIERGAEEVMLDVIDGNLPAYELYKSMGFTHYSSRFIFEHKETITDSTTSSIPPRYKTQQLTLSDWRLRYQLAQRITPEHVQEFEAVTEAKYKVPLIMRLLQPIITRLMGLKIERMIICNQTNEPVGFGSSEVRRNGKGTQRLNIMLDKNESSLSHDLFAYHLHHIRQLAPTANIELNLPDWQYSDAKIDPRSVGFKQNLTYHRLGMHTNF